jgi:hypothetical protein
MLNQEVYFTMVNNFFPLLEWWKQWHIMSTIGLWKHCVNLVSSNELWRQNNPFQGYFNINVILHVKLQKNIRNMFEVKETQL